MQNEKFLELNFIDYKFNKLKEELILELKRNISEKKINLENSSNDYFENLRKSINNSNNYINENNREKINYGLKSNKEDLLSLNHLKSDYIEENANDNLEYLEDEIRYPIKALNYDFNDEDDNMNFNVDEKKLSGKDFYRNIRTKGSKNSIDYSRKSISSTGKITDDENLFVQ